MNFPPLELVENSSRVLPPDTGNNGESIFQDLANDDGITL